MIRDLTALWDEIESRDEIRAVVLASSNFAVFCAGADIKEFTKMTDPAAGKELLDGGHGVLRRMEQSSKVTVAAVNSLALGGGCELAMACDFRIAAESASFGQPEINLGIIPGFGGTQRLARLVGEAKALEMNLLGEPISAVQAADLGLANEVVPDHELFDAALAWARKLAGQAPVAVEQIKTGLGEGRSGRGDRGREGRLHDRLLIRGRARGDRRVPRQAQAEVAGQVGRATAGAVAELAELIRESGSTVALTGAGVSVPSGIPDFRTPGKGLWEKVDPMSVATIDAFHRDTKRFWDFYRPRFHMLTDKQPNPAHEALAELERRGLLEAVITQNIDRLHRKAGSERVVEVHGSIATASCTSCDASYPVEQVESLFDSDGVATCGCCAGKVKPDVVLFGELLPQSEIAEAERLCAGADLLLCVGSSLEVYPVAGLPELTLAAGGRLAIVTQSSDPVRLGGRRPPRWRRGRGPDRGACPD